MKVTDLVSKELEIDAQWIAEKKIIAKPLIGFYPGS